MIKRPRSAFSSSELKSQVIFKKRQMPPTVQPGGFWTDRGGKRVGPLSFILPDGHEDENLFEDIRAPGRAYFRAKGIPWHSDDADRPSGHLLDSQVFCVNFLFPFVREPQALFELIRRIYPEAQEVLELASGEGHVAFEWIGDEDHLGEWPEGGLPTRGSMATSADAALRFRRKDGLVHAVLIEWKYTESYPPSEDYAPDELPYAGQQGSTRLKRNYSEIFYEADGPIDSGRVNLLDLFFEPLYQLMRQQMLAYEMDRHRELGADIITVLHISPAHNDALQLVTPERLRESYPGIPLTSLWPTLLRPRPDGLPRFKAITTGALFAAAGHELPVSLEPWWAYVSDRYAGALLI